MLSDLIKALDEYLKGHRPSFYAKLQPGLSLDEIKEEESRLGFALPQEIREVYLWKNGQGVDSEEPFQFNFYWMPLQVGVDRQIQLNQSYTFEQVQKDWWNPKWLPVLDNMHGDHLCIDFAPIADGSMGQLVNYWSDWEDRSVEYPDLASFLGVFLASMQQNMWKHSEEDGYQPVDEDEWEDFLEENLMGYPLDHEAQAMSVK